MVIVTLAVLALLDIVTGEVSTSIFYLIPISFTTWRLGKTAGIVTSFASALLWGWVEIEYGFVYSHPAIPVWNAIVRLGFFLIVTQALSALAVMQHWIRTDYLTGLANKRGFYEFADSEIYRSLRSGASFTLAYVDIDDFKSVNDRLGHGAGDKLLQLMGTTLQTSTRRNDVVARLGGDEFAVLLTDTNFESSEGAIRKLRDALNKALSAHDASVTYSVGAATFQGWSHSVDAALDEADRLMYEVKRAGKKSVMHRLINNPAG